MQSLTIYSTRGGNGKTISSLFLAIASAKRGIKTVLIDADLEAPSLIHLLDAFKSKYSWVDYLENPEIELDDLLNSCRIENLKIIFSPPPKVGKAFLGWQNKSWWKIALKHSLIAKTKLQEKGYEMIIIDNQSGTSYNSLNNLVFSEISIMVLRPASYGLGATEGILKEVFNSLKDMKERIDYYLWNQVHVVTAEDEKELLENFINKWDERLNDLGLKRLGKIDYNTKLNLSLLMENPDLLEQFGLLKENFNSLLDEVLTFGR